MFGPKAKIIEQDALEIAENFTSNEFSNFIGAKILVTGSTGLIGFYLVSTLKYLSIKFDLKLTIYCSSRNTKNAHNYISEYVDCDGIEFVEFGCENTLGTYDFIFHTASSTNPIDLATRPLDVIKTNVQYTYDLLGLLKKETGNFIFFSTREIYGKKVDPERKFVGESDYGIVDPLEIRSAYPESKRLGENMVAAFGMQYGNPYRVARISHTYGPGIKLKDGRVLSDIIGAMVEDESIHLKSDGTHQISPTYVADVISGLLVSLTRGESGCYNISNHNEVYSVYDIASTAIQNCPDCQVTRQDAPVNSSLYLKHDTGILLSEKISELGWGFRVPLAEGMQRIYSHYKSST
ncbi:NAD-dependent epimerase/dehydratase [Pseudovibrio sp. FO-BEG1]|uniref:NAD-dependent epimerase/dehydratase family protein n=1 Tax=Pseudovibrio sp. (strain FO-BEG1) TaxID=911045 RepID=UPI000238C54E|nr:NAD-dependent epimerase/dehydratase family protein [Pseudovibrio sp. FO-BEG1]AEV35463.1 NAD-dependent epimerase/dehydratase [Pseudovibrio sp. FO-BEG1]